jgi:hypothetical protein
LITQFNKKQQKQIDMGRRFGLPEDKIALYADAGFNYRQMRQIRLGLCDDSWRSKLLDNVHIYAKRHFNCDQMEAIRGCLYHSFYSLELALLCANPEFSDSQMSAIMITACVGAPMSLIYIIANPKFSHDEVREAQKLFKADPSGKSTRMYIEALSKEIF